MVKNTRKYPRYVSLKGFLSFFILHELSIQKRSGDELAKRIGKRKGTSLTPGTIYPALKRLRKHKLVNFDRQGRKKQYYLTTEGRRELRGLYAALSGCFSGLKSKIRT
ncbi:MAG: PadR family transcriptional regulator [Candidatus Woesearchaeota archaeon]